MKKFSFLLVSLGLLICGVISAQEKYKYKSEKHEIRLSIGSVGTDYYQQTYNYNNYYYGGYGYNYGYGIGGYPDSDDTYIDTDTYSDAKITTGVLGLSYFYHLPNNRFSVGATLSYNSFNQDYRKTTTDQQTGNLKEYNLAFTPSIRYAWVANPLLQLYSGIGSCFYLNVTKNKSYDEKGEISYNHSNTDFKHEMQLTLIGCSVGKKLFGFGEINIGGRAGIVVGGIGYHF